MECKLLCGIYQASEPQNWRFIFSEGKFMFSSTALTTWKWEVTLFVTVNTWKESSIVNDMWFKYPKTPVWKKLKYFREVGGDLICTCHCVGRHMWCNCWEKYWRDISKSRRKPDLYLSTDGMYHGFLSASPQLMLRHTYLSNAPWTLLHHNPSVVGGRGGDIGG